jgi:thioredoxin
MPQLFDAPIFTSDHAMDRLMGAGLPVLLVFVAGPVPAEMKRELERIARQRAGTLLVALAEIRDASVAARKFGVTGTPAVVDARGGAAVATVERVSAGELEAHARFLLGEGPKPQLKAAAADPARSPGAGDSAGPVTVTDATFAQTVLRAAGPVLVDFWAPWCGPCRITNPMFERLAREQAGRIIVAKVDVDENPETAARYQIQAVPTVLIVMNGTVVDRWSGALPEAALHSRVAAVVTRGTA